MRRGGVAAWKPEEHGVWARPSCTETQSFVALFLVWRLREASLLSSTLSAIPAMILSRCVLAHGRDHTSTRTQATQKAAEEVLDFLFGDEDHSSAAAAAAAAKGPQKQVCSAAITCGCTFVGSAAGRFQTSGCWSISESGIHMHASLQAAGGGGGAGAEKQGIGAPSQSLSTSGKCLCFGHSHPWSEFAGGLSVCPRGRHEIRTNASACLRALAPTPTSAGRIAKHVLSARNPQRGLAQRRRRGAGRRECRHSVRSAPRRPAPVPAWARQGSTGNVVSWPVGVYACLPSMRSTRVRNAFDCTAVCKHHRARIFGYACTLVLMHVRLLCGRITMANAGFGPAPEDEPDYRPSSAMDVDAVTEEDRQRLVRACACACGGVGAGVCVMHEAHLTSLSIDVFVPRVRSHSIDALFKGGGALDEDAEIC